MVGSFCLGLAMLTESKRPSSLLPSVSRIIANAFLAGTSTNATPLPAMIFAPTGWYSANA
jgi:hypothetical protein